LSDGGVLSGHSAFLYNEPMVADLNIAIALNYVDWHDPKKKKYQSTAMEVLRENMPDTISVYVFAFPWENVVVPSGFTVRKTLRRNSRQLLGNNRDLPYIKDVLSQCRALSNSEFFGYANSDILFSRDFFKVFGDDDAYIFYRQEIAETNVEQFNRGDYHKVWGGDKHPGNDAFFFKSAWWDKNESLFPDDLVLGETEWDTCYRSIIVAETGRYYCGRDLSHTYHDQVWTTTSHGAANNVRILNDLLRRYPLCRNALR
jgi:hypothetical protein